MDTEQNPIEMQNPVEVATINQWMADKTNITIYLKTGIGLKGKIIGLDKETITLDNGSVINNIQKHGISTIGPDMGPKASRNKDWEEF